MMHALYSLQLNYICGVANFSYIYNVNSYIYNNVVKIDKFE